MNRSVHSQPSSPARSAAPSPSPSPSPRPSLARPRRLLTGVVAGALALTTVSAGSAVAGTAGAPQDRAGWVNAWQGSPTAGGTFSHATCPADTGIANQTVRNLVLLSTGGDTVRVRVSNAFGAAPLHVGAASVAVAAGPQGAATRPGTLRALRFGGHASTVVPAGREVLSDPVRLPVRAPQRLALSVYLPRPTGPATQHNNSRETNYLAAGDRTSAAAASAFTTPIGCWLFTSGVDVRAARAVLGTVVALGDSITDGDQSTVDADQRYPDHLARRLAALSGPTLAVSNAGIGGNEVLRDRTPALFGVSALHRLQRDVLRQDGVREVILMEGINDIGAEAATAEAVIAGYRQIIARVHAAGLPIYAVTLVPFGGSTAQYGGNYGTAFGERQRQAVNRWIRTSGAFDAVFDTDRALRDPAHPDRLLAAYDSGDHLHPSDAGYRRMAATVDLRVLLRGASRGHHAAA